MGRVMTPDFSLTINGQDVTKLCIMWQLDDVEDGISTLTAEIGNPGGQLSGYLRTETDITLRYGYWNGKMSKPVTMKIKDKEEGFHTTRASSIRVVGMDCTEKLTGTTFAGNSVEQPEFKKLLESWLNGHSIKPQVDVKNPEKPPEKLPTYNMTGHAAVRWIMGMTECTKSGGGQGGQTPISGQQSNNSPGDQYKKPDKSEGDRNSLFAPLLKELSGLPKNYIVQNQKKAGNSVIYGHLQVIGYPGLEAKKCVTVQNVGSEGSGKWYVKKSSQRWHVDGGYVTMCELLRPTLGKDGKPIEQPVVMYANIYEKDTVTIKCREVDGESQATLVFGQPEENGDEMVMDFRWGIKLQKGRGAGEHAKSQAIFLNQAKKVGVIDAKKLGSYSSSGGGSYSGNFEGSDIF